MTSKTSTKIVLLIAILIIQIVVIDSQDVSVNPITATTTRSEPTVQPISLTNHVIKVGYMDFGFSRNNFTAGKGDVLFWDWEGGLEHSVIESTLENPCAKKVGGFDLGRHTAPHNESIAAEDRTYVFFSDVSDDCKKGMYGGINLPSDYTWPNDLATPPKQIVTTPLNPSTSTANLVPTGSMTIQREDSKDGKNTAPAAAGASGTSIKPSNTSSVSSSSSLKETNYAIIIGALLMSYVYY